MEVLPEIKRTFGPLEQPQISAYADFSGDHNKVHWDAEFAAKSVFGGIVAHGMLSLAFVEATMEDVFGRGWIKNGTREFHFHGAANLGAEVTVIATFNEKRTTESTLSYDIECLDENGRELVSGKVSLPQPNSQGEQAEN